MPSKVTKVLSARVRNETAEYFKGKPLNKVVESIHDLAVKKEVEIRGNGDVVISGSTAKREDGAVSRG